MDKALEALEQIPQRELIEMIEDIVATTPDNCNHITVEEALGMVVEYETIIPTSIPTKLPLKFSSLEKQFNCAA